MGWLTTSGEPAAQATGGCFFHLRPRRPSGVVHDVDCQERLLAACERTSGLRLPGAEHARPASG